ncbi:unnamed protein product [Calypogeia fissa]
MLLETIPKCGTLLAYTYDWKSRDVHRILCLRSTNPMLTESEGDQSEYEEHFTQSNAKGDKTREQANKTPTAEGSAVDKLGKKQKKQLQFHEPPASQTAVQGDLATTSSRGESRKDDKSKKNKDPAGRAAGPPPQQLIDNSTDKRKGKAAASNSSLGQ